MSGAITNVITEEKIRDYNAMRHFKVNPVLSLDLTIHSSSNLCRFS